MTFPAGTYWQDCQGTYWGLTVSAQTLPTCVAVPPSISRHLCLLALSACVCGRTAWIDCPFQIVALSVLDCFSSGLGTAFRTNVVLAVLVITAPAATGTLIPALFAYHTGVGPIS